MKNIIMSRTGMEYSIDVIANYMDDNIREQVHNELAPCKPKEFLKRYIELDPEFESLLKSEFSIDM